MVPSTTTASAKVRAMREVRMSDPAAPMPAFTEEERKALAD